MKYLIEENSTMCNINIYPRYMKAELAAKGRRSTASGTRWSGYGGWCWRSVAKRNLGKEWEGNENRRVGCSLRRKRDGGHFSRHGHPFPVCDHREIQTKMRGRGPLENMREKKKRKCSLTLSRSSLFYRHHSTRTTQICSSNIFPSGIWNCIDFSALSQFRIGNI